MNSDTYRTIKNFSQGLFKDKGSRFIALAYPVTSPEETRNIVESVKKEYYDARHHCFAYMIGAERLIWRVNDDGEPSGSAGKPILGQINSSDLTNILIVVVRYFGGTLLGVSGLINAYRSAAADALANARIIENTVDDYFHIRYPYAVMNEVMKILKEEDIIQADQKFDLECCINIRFRHSAAGRVIARFSHIEGLILTHLGTH